MRWADDTSKGIMRRSIRKFSNVFFGAPCEFISIVVFGSDVTQELGKFFATLYIHLYAS